MGKNQVKNIRTNRLWERKYFAEAGIAIAAIAIYLPTLSYFFSPLDDEWLISNRIELFTSLSSVKQFFSEPILSTYYRPVWISSYLLDVMLFGKNPGGFHFMNTLLHAIAAVLAYRSMLKINGDKTVSLCIALLFAVHPLNTQAVAWIPGRTEILLAIFFFITFIHFENFMEGRRKVHLLVAVLSFSLALLTKESAIVIPFVLLACRLLIRREGLKKNILPLTVFLPAILAWLLLRHSVVPVYMKLSDAGVILSAKDALFAVIIYIGKIFLPVQQAIMPTVLDTPIFPYLAVIAAMVFLTIRLRLRDGRIAAMGIAWFCLFLGLSVAAGSTNGNWEHYEQRAYLPLPGMLLFVSQINFERLKIRYPAALIILLTGMLALKTMFRSAVYRGPYEFAQAGISESPSKSYFHIIIGKVYADNNMPERALACYDKYISMNPGRGLPYLNKGIVYARNENWPEALKCYNNALRFNLRTADLYLKRMDAYASLNMWDSAWADLQSAKSLNAKIEPGLEVAIEKIVAAQKEIERYSRDILNAPGADSSYNLRGITYYALGDMKTAMKDFSSAIRINPDNHKAMFNRAQCYKALGMRDSADHDLRRISDLALKKRGSEGVSNSKVPEPSKYPQR